MIRAGVRRAFRLALRRRDSWEREVEDEIKLHLALRVEELVARGMPVDRAYQTAIEKFGPLNESRARLIDAAKHREARMQRTEYLHDLWQDLTFATRTLRRDKGWATVTILTLALGIAASTAVFSVVSSILLHAVPYPAADRVVIVNQQPLGGNNTGINVSVMAGSDVIRAWKARSPSFESLEAVSSGTAELATKGAPTNVNVAMVEPTFARFAGMRPILGRMFTPAEVAAHEHTALLGEGLWRTQYGADTAIVGKSITLDDSVYTVIGVLPATLQLPRVGAPPADVWMPIDLHNDQFGATVVGRLKPGRDLASAARELDSAYARATNTRKLPFRADITTPARRVSFRDSLMLLTYAVAMLLAVACANVAHLLLARFAGRQRELAIRVALGAGRGRVFRQLLTESVVIATAGGTLGILGGWAGLKAIVALRPPALSALVAAHLDTTTLVAALVVTIVVSLGFGVLGAVHPTRTSTHETLKAGGGSAAAAGRGRARRLLVVTEMALSATLVVGASLLVRSVINLQRADLGFDSHGLYALSLTAPRGHFANDAARGALFRTVASRLATAPGVRSVALASTPPTWFSFMIGRLEIEGQPVPSGPATAFVNYNTIGSSYISTMGIHLVQGTGFTDTTSAGGQVIVNERFARKEWHGASALGQHLRVASDGKEPWRTVVGVAAEAQPGGPKMTENTAPFLYFPGADSSAAAILVRTDGAPDMLHPLQALVASLDAHVTLKLESVETEMAQSISGPRFVMLLLTVFTAFALVLAAIGLYGVMAYSVTQRTREIGIRIALGATGTRIARGIVVSGVALALVGAGIGIAVALWGTKLIQHQLYGVAQRDTTSFVASVVVLLIAAVLACVIPARRALAVDPMTAIRAD
ncbi:MAG: ADOP family duplicated permease [Gemmatimonadales bacterium]